MKESEANSDLVASCGLYCGACRSYLAGRCPGCSENVKAGWCKIRSCCQQRGFATCAECGEFPDPNGCGKFNNFISRIFGLLFRSDRAACIRQIRKLGIQGHAESMCARNQHTIKR